MQFKPRKNKPLSFDVRRWTYDQDKKRSNAVHLGTLNLRQPDIPGGLMEKCSPPEQHEIQQFWKSMKEGMENEKLKGIASSFVQSCENVQKALSYGLLTDNDKLKIKEKVKNILSVLT
nr:hypothetical protein [Acetobacter syzygii]